MVGSPRRCAGGVPPERSQARHQRRLCRRLCVQGVPRASADPHGEESLNTNSTYGGFSAREFGTLRFLITSPSRFDRTVNLGGFWMRLAPFLVEPVRSVPYSARGLAASCCRNPESRKEHMIKRLIAGAASLVLALGLGARGRRSRSKPSTGPDGRTLRRRRRLALVDCQPGPLARGPSRGCGRTSPLQFAPSPSRHLPAALLTSGTPGACTTATSALRARSALRKRQPVRILTVSR